jgi:hypothetical protein
VGGAFKDKLERARDLMSHGNPGGELEAVLERGLDLLLEKLEMQRFGRSGRLRGRQEMSAEARAQLDCEVTHSALLEHGGRAELLGVAQTNGGTMREAADAKRRQRGHISQAIRRAVALRDGEQCTYRDEAGRRCPSRAFLQLHHERAHALGGPSTVENLRLLCGAHNRLLAERDFGRAHQERCMAGKSSITEAAQFERI